jgi:tyrosine-protein phosphatase SIW14
MHRPICWALSIGIAALALGGPMVFFRAEYAHHKRLRVVTPGVLYRSGQMTAAGFRDAVARYGIRTIINCQNEYPDPELPLTFWQRETVRESELCRDLGVEYIHLEPDLVPNRCDPTARPKVLDDFFGIVDRVSTQPILLHCKAGLHRTGVLVAAYRMEYDRWGPFAALEELKAHGFGDSAATAANDYIQQYVLNYRPRPWPLVNADQDGGSGPDSAKWRLKKWNSRQRARNPVTGDR